MKKELLYEGKGKRLYSYEKDGFVVSEFKDDLTAFNAQKKGSESGKGELNCEISTILFEILESKGIKTHFEKKLSPNTMLCKKVKIIPIEVVIRNVATGSLTKRLGLKEGSELPSVLVEFYYKDDALGDPLINDEHCMILGLVPSLETLDFLKEKGREVNSILDSYFGNINLKLVDFKLEFGFDQDGNILLADEISPDNCRLWDEQTSEKLDKDVFRQGLGSVKVAYSEVLNRMRKV